MRRRSPLQHWREPTPDATLIELHRLARGRSLEDLLALLLGQSAEVQLIVVAEEQAPLRRVRPRLRGLERAPSGRESDAASA